MQDNIPDALIAAFERHYDCSWNDPALRNERLAWRAAWAEATKPCLHQIQEPAEYPHLPSSAADVVDFGNGRLDVDFCDPAPAGGTSLYSAGQMRAYVDADRALRPAPALAAPAAVAVPDERAAFEKWASFVGYSIKRWQADANLYEDNATEEAWIAWQHRAALAATPAAAAPDAIDDEDLIAVPRGLLGAARAVIARKADAPSVLEKLRRYTTGDLSAEAKRRVLPAVAAQVVLPEPATFEAWAKSEGGDFARHNCGANDRDAMKLARMAWDRALLAGVSAPAGSVSAAAYDRLQALCDSQAARILAFEDAKPVHWRAVLDPEQVPHQLKTSMHVVGFRDQRSAESWIAGELDMNGWRYTLEPLYAVPQAQAAQAATFMTADQGLEWAWNDVRVDLDTKSWNAGESSNFYGFFLHGWNYRGQYEQQRAAGIEAVKRELMTAPQADAQDVRAIVEKLPRYTYGYKGDDWGMNQILRSYESPDGAFLRREEVLAAIATQAAAQSKG